MIRKPQLFNLINEGRFQELFIEELAWDKYRGQSRIPSIIVDEVEYNIETIAIRSGFQILLCYVDEIPSQATAKKIDAKLRRQAQDYICIYRKKNSTHDLWVVPIRHNEKRDIVLVEYDNGNAEVIWQKIDGITFNLDEQTNIVDLRAKVQNAFAVNSEKITKDFYAGFKKEHKAFAEFITGIDDHVESKNNRNKQWYTSVMLNRLMFCYFIQKKGFLAFDKDYLRNKLNWVRANEGENRFFNFYRDFLRHLFHDGLNSPRHSHDFESIFGKIPYLNGGMFDEHQLERDYADIDIPDEAFISLFDFFDKWNWHLDTRITASGRDINPDVLGYIFEQYINDRAQMGAYYTKEDITEYIGRNCILPFLFDAVRTATKDSSKYFIPDGFVWHTLRESGDRYIFDAVKKGYEYFGSIPAEISCGIITDVMRHEYSETPVGELPESHVPLAELRSQWNAPTPEQWGLPNEIWRETIERLQRCDDLLGKINRGEITSINDFITYNLDIRSFASDLLAKADNRFVGWFYHALQSVTILDPTCGSGAFLFAAMNILEPLYEICIERMQEFNQKKPNLFKAELAEIADKYRSNIQYFIFKSIILRNLYGVDIMVEATEIAKLRLFLKMVAVVDVDRRAENLGLDPLPDIDFNIRCGNTLVGYANKEQLGHDLGHAEDILQELANQEFKVQIEEEMEKVARAYSLFKDVQLRQAEDMSAFKQAKSNLRDRLIMLNNKLNGRLFSGYTGYQAKESEDITRTKEYQDWLTSHQPFHWLAEFYQIIAGNHGFDVVIGNPPYLESRQIEYNLKNYKTLDSGAVHVFCIERSLQLLNSCGNISMIVPLALVCTQRMKKIQRILEANHTVWYSNFAWRPAKLFDNVNRALTIFIANSQEYAYKLSTPYIKWTSENRNFLMKLISYTQYNKVRSSFWMPKLSGSIDKSILDKVQNFSCGVAQFVESPSNNKVYYRTTGGLYWKVFTNFSPKFFCDGIAGKSSRETSLQISSSNNAIMLIGILSSNLFWWWYTITSNLRDLNPSDIMGFSFPDELRNSKLFYRLSSSYLRDIDSNSAMLTRLQKGKGETQTQSFKISLSKPIIDEIDTVLARYYGFTDEELDFIINYDIKYRMGDELNTEE